MQRFAGGLVLSLKVAQLQIRGSNDFIQTGVQIIEVQLRGMNALIFLGGQDPRPTGTAAGTTSRG